MKTFTVVRNLTTRAGAIFQIPYRAFTSESDAKKMAQECQEDMQMAMRAELFIPMGQKLEPLNATMGKLFKEIGIVSFGHGVSWAEVSGSGIVVPEGPKIVTSVKH